MEKLYEGKAKILYKTDVPDVLLMKFKDDITSGNGVKKSSMQDDDLNDPLVNEGVVLEMKWATQENLIKMKEMANRVNHAMVKLFKQHELTLVDFKVEFGIDKDGQLVLADELTLDSMRLWDKNGDNLDKELFRQDNNIEIVLDAYQFINRIIRAYKILDLYI